MAQHQEKRPAEDAPVLEGGTYEIIRNRLTSQANELKSRLDNLNEARKEVFGAIDFSLLATDRITTRNNCIPRDMISIDGSRFLFGYNVHIGLKTETELLDVFALYEYAEQSFKELPLDILNHEKFITDFKNLYRYYRGTRFIKFSMIGPHLFMAFRVGKSARDIKTFKWAVKDGALTYIDNRSDHEFTFPPQHEFLWTRTHRDLHRFGKHPHVSIDDRLFVEAVGGDITFKVEDNTDSGQGIYAEPVQNPDQTLDDSEIFYALLGPVILVRIKPYMEENFRYFIFNEKTRMVHRVDTIKYACVLLPDDHGLIFPDGYYLGTGELKRFEAGIQGMIFEGRVPSANGEDYLYVFYHQESGDYILLSYNLIEQAVKSPVSCNGYSLFESGEMLIFKGGNEPARHHLVQIWQTPYVSGDYALSQKTGPEKSDSLLFKVGNPEIVRCMAECSELIKLLNRDTVYSGLYTDIVKKASDVADAYFWIDRPEAFNLKETLIAVKGAASGAIDEFEKVIRLKKETAEAVARTEARVREILERVQTLPFDRIDAFVKSLADLRAVRGEIISLKELRYLDLEAVDEMEAQVADTAEKLSGQCVEFLLRPESLDPYRERVAEIEAQIEGVEKVADANRLKEDLDGAARELEMLIEIVSNLKIEDATRTTQIIDAISEIYSRLNSLNAGLRNRKKHLMEAEGAAEFGAQMKLLNQSVISFLDVSDTPAKCEEYLTRMMVNIEELEGRFSDFDEFVLQLSEKRDEIYTAFESRKLNLIEARNRKADTLLRAAERILKGVGNRIGRMETVEEINAYFASDMMIEKVREIVSQLLGLEDSVKADDIQSQMKTVREDAVRRLKDRQDLYAEGANVIRLGNHSFSVNVQSLDLTVVRRDEGQWFHLTGTDFFAPITDPAFMEYRPVWDMEVPSENGSVYRAEYLAFQMLKGIQREEVEIPGEGAEDLTDEKWQAKAAAFMGPRYTEGYTKGIHDRDGAKILRLLYRTHVGAGLLRFSPRVRAFARIFWNLFKDAEIKTRIREKLSAFGMMQGIFSAPNEQERYIGQLQRLLSDYAERSGLFSGADARPGARYLFHELTRGEESFCISREGFELASDFNRYLMGKRLTEDFEGIRERLSGVGEVEFEVVRDWVAGYAGTPRGEEGRAEGSGDLAEYIDEAAALIFQRDFRRQDMIEVAMNETIEGMAGDHPLIRNGIYAFNYLSFMERLNRHEAGTLPMYNRYQALKKALVEKIREEMRLEEFRPRILSSFVRNRLINRVYLPLIGDNLAKQIGVAGEAKRTDLMGLLLVISPPGYGKTTLMEYIANRLGIIFMKINGPAIGHRITSLDPADAPFASAREEIKKLNLSFEMGDNVMIYLDDIQHCNPELLQKFISLCDGQRKIEGVYKGKSRTYDLRGKKVVVVMAGNPYTESGEKFQIPDMLANRADTYNLGDIIGDSGEDFKLSYLENSLTSNPTLNRLSSRSQDDVYAVVKIAETGSREGVDFVGNYSAEEINEMVSVMKKLMIIRDVISAVNREYIRSAGQSDQYRTEPAFRLQGSYRNMNRIAEKVLPVMNDAELKTLILSHYGNESQTLTSGAEANFLKFKELTGWMDDEEKKRWEEIKKTFRKNKLLLGGDAGDPITRVVAQLSAFGDGLEAIEETLSAGMAHIQEASNKSASNERAGAGFPAEISLSKETLTQLQALFSEMNISLGGNAGHAPLVPHTARSIHKMKKTDLSKAIRTGDLPAVRALLAEGGNPNVTTPDGATPLMAAAFFNQPDVARLLIEAGARIDAQDKDGYSPLMIAAAKGNRDAAEVLIGKGADPSLKDKDGLTAADWAEKNGNGEVSALLI